MISHAALEVSARAHVLVLRGAFHPDADDAVPGLDEHRPAQTLVLLGFTGRDGWPTFARSPEASDGADHPLDRWSRRVVGELAQNAGAQAVFPFDGPPWHPFGHWAMRAENLAPSPLGILIHPRWGLWHSYRGALAFAERFDTPLPDSAPGACKLCAAKACLAACPVGAFSEAGFDAAACRDYLSRPASVDCRANGCLARRACPVGAEHAYGPEQSEFLINAFVQSGPS